MLTNSITGAGKSLCYQIPPLVTKKMGVVVSPLISLMQDQVEKLLRIGVRASFLGSAQTDASAYRVSSIHFTVSFLIPRNLLMEN